MTYDVLEVDIASGEVVGVMAQDKDERNAEAVMKMAVIRRGVEHSIYVTVPSGTKSIGDTWGD